MSTTVAAAVKAAIAILSNEEARKKVGWVIVAILSPLIVLVVLLCAILSGTSQHNVSAVELCFHGGSISASATPECRRYIEDMRNSFAQLDEVIVEINSQCEDGESLDDTRIKAIFYALYFAAEQPDTDGIHEFADCFVDYEERTRTVTTTDEEGNEVETTETYMVAVPIEDLAEIYERISNAMGVEITADHQANADSIYNLILYGSPSGGSGGWFPGADVPFIGVDGFCSPIGAGWESVVTSEFGYRSDPFTGETRGHTGMDLAVPTGTPTHGWADVNALLAGISRKYPINRDILEEIVRSDEKQRYSFSEDGTKIRANQGHSIQVDVELPVTEPPETLYHGTAQRFAASIEVQGLLPQSRLYVHLSPDPETAEKVGQRHGQPVIYLVDAGQMHRDGYLFYLSANGVWLTKVVPAPYLKRLEE